MGDEVKAKIIMLAKKLSVYLSQSSLYIVPFGTLQQKIAKVCESGFRTLFFRCLMLQTAEKLAKQVGSEVIVTGDSLGQVSSQTLKNLAILDKVTRTPVFRPLIGFSKQEIIQVARQIETFDISLIPHDDACSLLADKHPVIYPQPNAWDKFGLEHEFSSDIDECIGHTEIIELLPKRQK